MKYFRANEDPTAKLPQNFMTSFLEVLVHFIPNLKVRPSTNTSFRAEIELSRSLMAF